MSSLTIAMCPQAQRRGSTLILVVLTALILLVLAGGMVRLSLYQTRDRAGYETYKDEFAAAEVALNKTYAHLQHLIQYGTPNFDAQVAAIAPPTVQDVTFDEFAVNQLFNGNEVVTEGQWTGLNLHRLRYRIDTTARKTGGSADRFAHPGVRMSQNLEVTYIPLYLFAIFYDPVMEIAPGPFMQVNGLVHANGDAYVQSGNGLDFMENVTVAGSVVHGRHPQSAQSVSGGSVRFTNGASLLTMLTGGTWLDSTVPNWGPLATARWDEGLRDDSHGVMPMSLPIPSAVDPHAIIERADPANDSYSLQQEKLEYKASLKIVRLSNGSIVGYDAGGNTVPLTYPNPSNPSQTKSVYATTTFYDAREAKTVSTIDVNLANMIEGNIIPPNGILYVSNEDQGANPGVVRLTNGSRLPTSPVTEGFSVATDDPIYIKGDYNTVNKTLSMVAGDALYLLSNSWNDANSNNYAARVASNTTVNAVCLHGIVPTADSTWPDGRNYSGGVENNFRFLEKWSGKNLTFSGSIVIMWASQKALGRWLYGNPIYEAPTRLWSWDTALGGVNGPPGAPRVVEIAKTAWEMTPHGEAYP